MRIAVALLVTLFPAALEQKAVRPAPKVAWTTAIDAPSFGAAAVADIDGDGRLEVAFGTYFGDNSVRVLNGEDGSEYWRYDAQNACLDASLRFCDLDGDGDLELVVPVSNKGWVLAFDAKSGDELWRYGTQPIECTDTPPTVMDVDDDGRLEVVYGTFKGRLHVISNEGERERMYEVCDHFVQTGPTVTDLDGDGVRDFVCATFKGDNRVYAVSGKSGERLWHFQVSGEHMGMYHGCSVADIDRDGSAELVIAAYDGKVYCLEGKDGRAIWTADPDDRYFMSPTAVADLDGDRRPEVIVASENVTVIDAKGKIRWSKPCARGGWDAATRGVSIADLDGDGKLDVASLSGSGILRVFRGRDGALLYEFDASSVAERRVASSSHGVTIADLTGDGRLDVFFVVGATHPEKHGLAVCLTGFAGKGRGWYMLRHDPQNSGNVGTELDPVLLRHIENLKPAEEAVMRPGRAPKVSRAEPPRRTQPAAPQRPDLPKVRALAAERGIPEAALEAVLAANKPRAPQAALEKVAKLGRKGFAAACLLIETGHGGTFTVPILERTWEEGREWMLLALCERKSLPNYGLWTALNGLGVADTKEVRAYLLDRIERERGAGLFMCAAQALGRLKEPKATETVAIRILEFKEGWSGVEVHLLSALPGMGGREANPWLARYLADARGKHVVTALRSIASTDPKMAAAEAEKLLGSDREIPEEQRASIRELLGRGKSE
ncbi:MAG: FG-GAP-like repeat-containing protein [Planctomycetota bacterium]|jgi:outer membrane protein assembly factor BamB